MVPSVYTNDPISSILVALVQATLAVESARVEFSAWNQHRYSEAVDRLNRLKDLVDSKIQGKE
jgi:hypothetical protein